MEPSVFDGIVAMCSTIHRSVSVKSAQYLDEMRRNNYVTPTSYLELINMIKMVLEMRQKAVSEKRALTLTLTPTPTLTLILTLTLTLTLTPNPNPTR